MERSFIFDLLLRWMSQHKSETLKEIERGSFFDYFNVMMAILSMEVIKMFFGNRQKTEVKEKKAARHFLGTDNIDDGCRLKR